MSKKCGLIFGAFLVWLFAPVGMAFAQYTSPHYMVNETFFGAGGGLQEISPSYQAQVALGELGISHSTSTNYQIYSGFNTTTTPVLEVTVTGGTYDFGTLSTTQVSAISTVFTVESYLCHGYVVGIGGSPPKNNGSSYTLNNLTSPTASSPGTEQFGINLAANNLTGPGVFGAAPQQIPDSTFGFGTATSAYNTGNLFKYVENDTVAQSTQSSGITQYTLSAIANISTSSPGGSYATSLFVNVTPTF